MDEWYRMIQAAVDAIDAAIRAELDEELTLRHLAEVLGYSPFHTTRQFHTMTGMSLRDYLRGRRLAFALVEVRDSDAKLLDIAVRYGFSSHEAFTRAFKRQYGLTPGRYRKHPVPVVLRTKINPLDRYLIGQGAMAVLPTVGEIKVYFTKVPAHQFLHIKNYESDGYMDFWEKQDRIPGQDCDTICGMLDSIPGKLDGDDSVVGQFSGQVMGYLSEPDGRCPEAYGIRLPADFDGPVPQGMLLLEVPEAEYAVFEHGPFDFESQCEAVYAELDRVVRSFRWQDHGCRRDDAPGRVAYYYNDPSRFLKRVLPVTR